MLDALKNVISLFLLIPGVCIVGLYLSFKLQFLQCSHILKAWKLFVHDRDPNVKSTSFSALSAVLGGNLGTGNISGIAVALATGGPGALFWMWIMAIFGAVLKFAGTTLGILYREKNDLGEHVGGPMYYLTKGLNLPFAAKLFCIFTILSALTVGNMVQMNSIALPFVTIGIPPVTIGIIMSVLVGLVIMGGLKRFSVVASKIVPAMAVLYVFACLIILSIYFSNVIPAILLIFKSAFSTSTVIGGVAGYTVLEGIRAGFDRGLFATDAGAGLSPIIHSTVESKAPKIQMALAQGLISTLSPLIVMVVCTLTGLVLIVTGAWQIQGLESTNTCFAAFNIGMHSHFAGHFVTVILFFFAFTTILTWSFCADKAIEFLFSRKMIRPFQVFFVLIIPFGILFKVKFIWSVADIFMNAMVVINLIGVIGLAKHVFEVVDKNKEAKRDEALPLVEAQDSSI